MEHWLDSHLSVLIISDMIFTFWCAWWRRRRMVKLTDYERTMIKLALESWIDLLMVDPEDLTDTISAERVADLLKDIDVLKDRL